MLSLVRFDNLLFTLICFSSTSFCLRADETLIADFEQPSYPTGWIVSGSAFGEGPAAGTLPNQHAVTGYRGRGLINTFHGGDNSTGTLTSTEFKINAPYLCFLIGGGNHPEETGIELLINGQSVRQATGGDSEALRWHNWDVGEFVGRSAKIRIYDSRTGGWGHINVDQILLADKPQSPFDDSQLKSYRLSPDYLSERQRPLFHFAPERNWINDPNGLVYLDGEYHLFYQSNPAGNGWGHMSWGHAVSRDLVHWKHLPLALAEEDGVMIFSGSAVVDARNTSGFGTTNQPAMVAIYTAHRTGNQSQALAYSIDRGRTWKKYPGNPIIDLGKANFRDPKVFWHEDSRRWIMAVSLATEKKIQFYASKNLKQWELQSEFGPLESSPEPNWECPDLIRLPVEGSDDSKWLLAISVGDRSVAGGSGVKYFVGDFDGQRFVPESPSDAAQWADYGRDFYAVQSWNNLPPGQPQTWIAWMNNWQSHMLPTTPWRGEMTLPRELKLRKTAQGKWTLLQIPTTNLAKLMRRRYRATQVLVDRVAQPPFNKPFHAEAYQLKFRINDWNNQRLQLSIHETEDHATTCLFNGPESTANIDRSNSGAVDFHPSFAGTHTAPIAPCEHLDVEIWVDRTSIELFINQGAVVMTERVFPGPGERSLTWKSLDRPIRLEAVELNEIGPVPTLARPSD